MTSVAYSGKSLLEVHGIDRVEVTSCIIYHDVSILPEQLDYDIETRLTVFLKNGAALSGLVDRFYYYKSESE